MKITIPKSVYSLSVYVLLIAAVIFFGIIPGISRLNNDRSTIQDNNKKLAASEAKISELSKYNKNKSDLETVESTVNNLLPGTKASSDFVVQIEALGNELSIVIPTLTISEPVTKAAPAPVDDTNTKSTANTGAPAATTTTAPKSTDTTFNLSFKAPFTTFKTFLGKIESFPRFTALNSVTISSYSADTGLLEYSMKGNIYYGK